MIHAVNIVLVILLILFLFVGIYVLQSFLSKRQNKWLGLILPACYFFVSIMLMLALTADPDASIIAVVFQRVTTFLIMNVPTLILLAIYWKCREKLKKGKGIERMRIQDLD